MNFRICIYFTVLLGAFFVVLLFFAPSLLENEEDFYCPVIEECEFTETATTLSSNSFGENEVKKSEVSLGVNYDKEIKVCVSYIIHKHKREREKSFEMIYMGRKFTFEFIHVYSQNDNLPKDNREGFIVFPEFADYHTLLKKVWFGFSYFRDKDCDYVFKMDDDITMDYLTMSYFIYDTSPSAWIGRHQAEGRKCSTNEKAKWHSVPYYHYTKDEKKECAFTDFMYGQFYGFGKKLYDCVVKDIDRRVASEPSTQKYRFVTLHLEDVGMGLPVNECKKQLKDFSIKQYYRHHIFGEYLGAINKIHWEGLILLHQKVPERKSSKPLWDII